MLSFLLKNMVLNLMVSTFEKWSLFTSAEIAQSTKGRSDFDSLLRLLYSDLNEMCEKEHAKVKVLEGIF